MKAEDLVKYLEYADKNTDFILLTKEKYESLVSNALMMKQLKKDLTNTILYNILTS